MDTGVYTITCLINNKIYCGSVGSENNSYRTLKRRKVEHFRELRKNKHFNWKLQEDFNLYGESNFIYEVLEEHEPKYCRGMEQYWMNMLNVCNDKFGYNINPIAEDGNVYSGVFDKPVLQYDLEGNFVKEFKSIHQAGRDLNISYKLIHKALNFKSSKGSQWKYKLNDTYPLKILSLKEAKYLSRKRQLIARYNLSGELIKIYDSIKEAVEDVNGSQGTISAVAIGKGNTCYNSQWKYFNSREEVILKINSIELSSKKVIAFNDNEFVEFESLADAGRFCNTFYNNISNWIKTNKFRNGYYWKFK
jgi:hypothetical protein